MYSYSYRIFSTDSKRIGETGVTVTRDSFNSSNYINQKNRAIKLITHIVSNDRSLPVNN